MPKLDVDAALIRKLAELLKETGLNEIEYENGVHRIRVNRGVAAAGFPVAAATAASAAVAPAPSAPAAARAEGPPDGAVTSPMVGTAYVAAEPGGAPFVKIGDRVKNGQTLLIIEAMKVMNPIPAPRDGTVTEILVADGRPVEFGEVLMVLT
jgi:acetyl-CoA carboxylase biotin carboxyl carrier protein